MQLALNFLLATQWNLVLAVSSVQRAGRGRIEALVSDWLFAGNCDSAR